MKKQLLYKLSFSFTAVVLLLCSITSCKKFVTVDPPQNQIESVKIFSNDQTAISAISGLYGMIGISNTNFINGGITLYTAAAADEIYATSPNTDLDPFTTNTIPASHTNLLSKLWRAAYNNSCIYTTNSIIAALEKSTSLTDSVKNRLTGESKVIRALAYFYLVNLFGDVPLVLTPDFETNSLMPRTAVDLIQNQIINDLSSALNLLDPSYPTVNRARINKWTAAALLARYYLYKKEWSNAEQYASQVIDCGLYSMNNSLSNVFSSPASNETIWQLARDNNPTSDGATFIPASTTIKPTFAITSFLLNSFQSGDFRKTTWLSKNTISGVDYYFPFKYKSRLATQPIEYSVLFRLAEQYLIRAEARVELGNISGAISDLNVIRNRAGLPNTTAITQSALRSAIFAERQIELFCEMGHRWFDLNRTGNANIIMPLIKGANWQSTDGLFPIPQPELDKNPFLIQNPGY